MTIWACALHCVRWQNRCYRDFGKCNAFWSIALPLGFT